MNEFELIDSNEFNEFSDVNLESDTDEINFEFDNDIDIDFFQKCTVNLNNNDSSTIVPLKPGMYIVTINPLLDNIDQTVTFSISKQLPKEDPQITIISNIVAKEQEPISIELFWPDNNILFIKKNNKHYNGEYNIDFFINKHVFNTIKKTCFDLNSLDILVEESKNIISKNKNIKDSIKDSIENSIEVIDDPEELKQLMKIDNETTQHNENTTTLDNDDTPSDEWKNYINIILDFIFPAFIVSYTIVQISLYLI